MAFTSPHDSESFDNIPQILAKTETGTELQSAEHAFERLRPTFESNPQPVAHSQDEWKELQTAVYNYMRAIDNALNDLHNILWNRNNSLVLDKEIAQKFRAARLYLHKKNKVLIEFTVNVLEPYEIPYNDRQH